MAYAIKNPEKRKVSYSEREVGLLRKKPSFPEIFRSETRIAMQVPQQTHKVGQIVKYKGELYAIRKKTNKGVYVSKIKEDKEGLLDVAKKEEFISEKELFEGKAYPYYPLISWGLI